MYPWPDETDETDDDAATDAIEALDPMWPRAHLQPRRTSASTFAAVHGAYHVLSQRIRLETRDCHLSPSEAVVLATILRERQTTISVVRQRTGLRASTLDSLLDRLETRDLIRRARPRDLRGEVTLDLSPEGADVADRARAALGEIEDELAGFVPATIRAAVDAVFEASRALGVPGTASDY